MDKENVIKLLNDALQENDALYLIELKFLPENKIYIEVDGDGGVSLQECIRISRAIENNLDREEEDFALEVTTPDFAHPLKVKRQYKKKYQSFFRSKIKRQYKGRRFIEGGK